MRTIGNTPLIILERLSEPGCTEIYVKYEGANPNGSMKDRMALAMIEGAEKRGELKPGGFVIEYTGGSTGSSLAMVCAYRGYQAHNTFWTDQFNNVDNKNAYHKMAREILDTLDGKIDEFIAGVGTGACFSGNSEVFKNELPNIRCIPVEPDGVRSLSGGNTSGSYRLEGIGPGKRIVTVICDSGLKYLKGDLYKSNFNTCL